MGFERHARLARLAFARGYIDLATFGAAMFAIGRSDAAFDEARFVGEGWLTDEQLRELRNQAFPDEAAVSRLRLSGNVAKTLLSPDVQRTPPPPSARPTRVTSSGPKLASDERVTVTAASSPPTDLPVTARPDIANRYISVRPLGQGGMGQVVEAIDPRLGRRVAVKTVLPDHEDDGLAMAMLEREARVIGTLEHPSIIPVYDAGTIENGSPFYAMRLFQQPTLEEVLRSLRRKDATTQREYGQNRLLRHFIQVCYAVDYAHSRGIVHCDLKPSNVLLGSFGEVLVLDWGLAYSVHERLAYRGGTPSFMAPEQLDPGTRAFDARTDVFALGAILYEILCLVPAFGDASPSGRLLPASRDSLPPVPPRPRDRAPARGVPEELEEIVMRALELDPDARFPTAHAFAAALEAFLEGTKEKERRAERATDLVAQGDGLAESFHELVLSRPERLTEVRSVRARIAPWAAPDEKQELWDSEDRREVMEALAIRTFQAAVAAYEQALDEVPNHPGARRGLAALYRDEIRQARERRDDFDRLYFEGLLAGVDDDHAADGGRLVLRATGSEAARVVVQRLDERGRRLVAGREEDLGPLPVTAELPTGSYVASVGSSRNETRVPFVVAPGEEVSLAVDLGPAARAPRGMIHVPAGPALLGEDGDLARIAVAGFYLAELPVTFAEYLAFVDDAFRRSATAAERHLPRSASGAPYWRWDGDALVADRILAWGDADVARGLPVFGIDLASAEAFAAWKSVRESHVFRLPTEHEWEKAARGVDGRRFPWGDRFDPAFCKMRASRSGAPTPEPPGTFEHDVSPYGIHDLAGGIAEWVASPAEDGAFQQALSRGGAWCDWEADCRLGVRRVYWPGERSSRVGMRLAADV